LKKNLIKLNVNSNKVVYWINSNKSYISLHKQHVYQLYMLSYQIPSYKTSHHIIHVYKYVLSLHYIRVTPSNYNYYLTSEMVNSNWLNTRTQTFTRHLNCSIRKIKFLLVWIRWWYWSVKRMRCIPWHFNTFI